MTPPTRALQLGAIGLGGASFGLLGLARLRWVAVFGQLATVIVVSRWMEIRLPEVPVVALICITAVSNAILESGWISFDGRESWVAYGALAMDIVVFSLLLALCGGLENPFAVFYLVHLAMVSILSRGRVMMALMALIGVGFLSNLFFFHPLHMPFTHAGRLDVNVYLQGHLMATGLAGACVAWFVFCIRRSVERRDKELARMREEVSRSEFYRSLAALAAGVAHEMNTPLGTIAIASEELEARLRSEASSALSREDAELIRSEVNRCRVILERLNARTTAEIGDPSETVALGYILDALMAEVSDRDCGRVRMDFGPGASRGTTICVARRPLIQSLAALVRNGLDADASGQVQVRIEVGDVVRIVVLNDGALLDPEECQRMIQPFYTTKQGSGGMGLGLFLVNLFAERSGGRLTLLSRPAGGLEATLELPILGARRSLTQSEMKFAE